MTCKCLTCNVDVLCRCRTGCSSIGVLKRREEVRLALDRDLRPPTDVAVPSLWHVLEVKTGQPTQTRRIRRSVDRLVEDLVDLVEPRKPPSFDQSQCVEMNGTQFAESGRVDLRNRTGCQFAGDERMGKKDILDVFLRERIDPEPASHRTLDEPFGVKQMQSFPNRS